MRTGDGERSCWVEVAKGLLGRSDSVAAGVGAHAQRHHLGVFPTSVIFRIQSSSS